MDTAPDRQDPQEQGESRKWYEMSASEFYVYVVAFMCGVSMMMPINAVFSAPAYIMTYYRYAMQDPDAVPLQTNFWNNVMTYYNLIGILVSLIMEPLTLLSWFRRIPIKARLFGGLIILIVEIIVLMVVPARGTNEAGAVATICCASFIGGFGKSIFESTTYGMFGAFPSSFTSTMMGGVGMSGVLTSLLQISVKAALPDSYEGVKKQSKIYYGLDVGIQIMTFIALGLLRFNSFAQNYFGDLGAVKSKVDAGKLSPEVLCNPDERPVHGKEGRNSSSGKVVPALGEVQMVTAKSESPDAAEEASWPQEVEGPTSNEILVATSIFSTLRCIKWMFIACAFDFLITLFLFPAIAVGMFPDSKWFSTIAVFIFNVFDVLGRFSPSLKFMWPKTYKQRWIIVAASFARVIFVPLLLLHSYHYIPSEEYGYVMEVIFGFSNGYVGSMALVLGPQSKGIDNDGKRFVAGTLMGISILVGATIGTVLSIMTQTIRERH
ncbi:putative nucleoside transporter 1 [Leishmania mexicana MHOM/GT/2001/U1103]|uniref:Nucleoside transporter 1 n=1 Tax=Leishmania mexicana (strain MHOM/GT/2001/U1103) TaxID=929439 RepID=E9AQB5_LEIMU|nr:putative nucleoside transporter 1 [Leishmania mexicana MHOM/GT/2001/U1103]CBZ25134.1 putative nucleoside transporter 1 [Leishmania mexicana MHOM/GT/2001/U1103]